MPIYYSDQINSIQIPPETNGFFPNITTNLIKGALLFVGGYLLYKSVNRIRPKEQTDATKSLYSHACTFSMGLVGTGIVYATLRHQ